jgi:hypothetical protein
VVLAFVVAGVFGVVAGDNVAEVFVALTESDLRVDVTRGGERGAYA